MEDARRAVIAAAGDVLEEKPRAATAVEAVQDIGGVKGGAGQTATVVAAADLEKEEEEASPVLKRKLAKTGFKSPYDSDYDNDEEYEYNSGDDVEHDNKESFIEKESQKIREKGKAAYLKRGKFRCPYFTTKPKPKDELYEHLMSHACGLSTSVDDIKIRAEHAALLKALGPI
ncbi:hypothetical protein D1007_19388 [Hordeum vulgare]|nr:hypothetical protein D1007_19388 [Hordeum vulgare]